MKRVEFLISNKCIFSVYSKPFSDFLELHHCEKTAQKHLTRSAASSGLLTLQRTTTNVNR